MFSLVSPILSIQMTIYLAAFWVIEVVSTYMLLEFIRPPWEGRKKEIDRVKELNENKIFDSLDSIHQFTNADGSSHYMNQREKFNRSSEMPRYN